MILESLLRRYSSKLSAEGLPLCLLLDDNTYLSEFLLRICIMSWFDSCSLNKESFAHPLP